MSTCCAPSPSRPRRQAFLRPATAGDLPAIRDLLTTADLPTDDVDRPLLQGFAVAELDGAVIGAAAVEEHPPHALLRSVVVAPAHRGSGLGTTLVEERASWAAARGLADLYLLTTSAAPWFAARGFAVVDRETVPESLRDTPELSSLCPASATLLRRQLGTASATKERVREHYASAARQALGGKRAGCGPSAGCESPVTVDLYPDGDTAGLPAGSLLASLGCGNPTSLAELVPGEVVLDLGSGGGIDVLLSARRVAPGGKAYGLDMTDEMLELARENLLQAGVDNAELLRGDIEAIPLPTASVDVVISNCVLNLAVDKRRALGEAFRVLRPGGRFAVSDIVVRGPLPEVARRSLELWAGCVAGALEEEEYRRLLAEVGFEAVEVEPTRVFGIDDARDWLADAGLDPASVGPEVDGRVMSASIRARKPPSP